MMAEEKANTSLEITLNPCSKAYLDVEQEPAQPSIKHNPFHLSFGMYLDSSLKIQLFNLVLEPI